MKKLLALAIIASMGIAQVFAQDAKTDEFNGHWYVQLQGGVGHTVGETTFGNLISPAAAFNFGYRFTPVWGLRAGVGGWEARGALSGPSALYRYNYLQGSVDVTADICSIFSGYRVDRFFTPYLFAGVGVNGAFNNAEAQSMASRFPSDGYLWDGGKVSPAGRFGLGTGIRISDAVQFNIELNANFLSDKFNSKQGSAVDWQLGAVAGFTFNIGLKKASRHTAPAQEYIPAPAPAPEPAPVPAQPEEKPVTVQPQVPSEPSAPEFKAVEKDIFFTIGKSALSSAEQVKIDELVKLLEDNPETLVTVTGHADSETGSAARNMELSKERAENVAAAIKAAGIDSSRVIVQYKGDTANPFSSPEQNRVAVCIVDAGNR